MGPSRHDDSVKGMSKRQASSSTYPVTTTTLPFMEKSSMRDSAFGISIMLKAGVVCSGCSLRMRKSEEARGCCRSRRRGDLRRSISISRAGQKGGKIRPFEGQNRTTDVAGASGPVPLAIGRERRMHPGSRSTVGSP